MCPIQAVLEPIEEISKAILEFHLEPEEKGRDQCVMIADLGASRDSAQRLGDILAEKRREKILNEVVLLSAEAYGGRVLKALKDAWVFLFSTAQEAIRAAVEMQNAVSRSRTRLNEVVGLRVSLETVAGLKTTASTYQETYSALNRLMNRSTAGEIVISESIYSSFAPQMRRCCAPLAGALTRSAAEAATAYRIQWEADSSSEDGFLLPERIDLEILWNQAESRMSWSSSFEEDKTLISYEAHTLDLTAIEEISTKIQENIRLANLGGALRVQIIELEQLGKRLFSLLFSEAIGKKIRESPAEFLVLKLDDACVHIPWELAHDGLDFLCCRFSIGRLVRTSQRIRNARRAGSPDAVSFLVISDPCGNLPSAEQEGRLLYNLYQADPRVTLELLNHNVSPQSVKSRLGEYDIIHYCGHAEFCENSPDESGWILSGGKFTGGALEEFVQSGQPGPLVVFNNACHSGATSAWNQGSMGWSYGLANAFLLAGSTHYVGVMSELLDISSNDFAQAFYRGIIAGFPVGRALRQARMKQRRNGQGGCLTWAQYILFGDPEAGVFEPLVSEIKSLGTSALETGEIPLPGEEYRLVVSVDLGRYSAIVASLEKRHGLGPQATHAIQSQIREMLRKACKCAGVDYDQCLADFTGDGSILGFESAEQVDIFAEGLIEASTEWNKTAKADEEFRCFRIGAFDGNVVIGEDGHLSGSAVSSAVRLEQKGSTGEIIISRGIYDSLPPSRQALYGPMELIPGKEHDDPFPAHRRRIGEPAPWERLRGGRSGGDSSSAREHGQDGAFHQAAKWRRVKLAAAAVVLLLAAGYLATLRAPWQSSGSSALRDQALQNLWRARPQAANAADLAQLRQDLDPATQHALEGIMAINQGDQAAARTALERAIAMSPSHSLASLGLARIEWAGGDATKAKGALQQVLSGGDASTWEKAEALRLLGQISSAGGETSQALDYYRQASDLQGEDSWLLAEKGVLLEKDGNYQAALAAYEEAARRSPEDQFVLSLRKACAEHIRKKEDQEWAQEIRSSLDRLREKLAAPSRPAGETDPWTSRPLGIAALNLAAEGMPPSRLGEEKGLLLALEQEFMQTDRWFIVERERLEAVLQELEIGSSELADSKYSMEVGRFLAARFLLAGTVFRGGPESRISLRLIDTETRRVAAVAEKSCTGELMAAAEDLTSQLSARLAKGYALRGRIESTTGTIVLNIGSLHGVRPGQRFEVFSKETNPRSSSSVTGLSSIGEIEVKTVGESDAACEKTQSDADLQAGMRVQEKGINPPASSS